MTTYFTNTTFTVGSTGDYTTIQDALDGLLGDVIAYDAIVTLQLLPEVFNINEPIILSHVYGTRIRIKAAIETTLSYNGIVNLVSNGAGNHELEIKFSDVTGVAVGDFIDVKNLTGSLQYKTIHGTWEVLQVNNTTNTLVLKVKDRRDEIGGFTIASGAFKKQNSIIKANNCDGFIVNKDFGNGSSQTAGLHDICLVGDGTPLRVGVLGDTGNKLSCLRMKVVNFGRYGYSFIYNSTLNALLCSASGNGLSGFYILNGSVGQIVGGVSTGNKGSGVVISNGGVGSTTTCILAGCETGLYANMSNVISERSSFDCNLYNGVLADQDSYCDLDGKTGSPSTAQYNGRYGIKIDDSSEVLFEKSIATDNAEFDFKLTNHSKIKVKDTTYNSSEITGLSFLVNLTDAEDHLELDRLTAKEYVKTKIVKPLD